MNGADQMAQMKAAGFSDDEVSTYRDQTMQQMTSAGFSNDETSAYFGVNANPDMSKVTSAIKSNIDTHVAANVTPDGQKKPLSFVDAIGAGLGSSVPGLLATQKVPTELTGNEPWYTRTAYSAAQMVGDLPVMAAGAAVGGPVGTAGGGAVGSVVPVLGTTAGAAVGGVVGAGAGAFAAPTAIREALIDGYKNGGFKNFGDFWDRYAPILMDTAKSATIGAATVGVGGAAAKIVGKTALPALAQTATVTASEIATVASVGKALDGQMPTAQDFTDAAILLGGAKAGMHIAPRVTAKLQQAFAKKGVTPDQIVRNAPSTPSIVQDLASITNDVPTAYGGDALPKDAEAAPLAAEQAKAPLVDAYHGTNAVFDEYGTDKDVEAWREMFKNSEKYAGKIDGHFYFTDDPKTAGTYADGDGGLNAMGDETHGNIRPVKLDTTNWHEVDAEGVSATDRYALIQKAVGDAMEQGKEGVILKNASDPLDDRDAATHQTSTVYIAFRRNQIRSRFEDLPPSLQTPEMKVEDARQQVMDKIKDPIESDGDPSKASFYTKVIDQRDPIRQAEKAMGAGDESAYNSAFKRMSLLPGIDSTFEGWMKFGPRMPDGVDATGPALADILAPHKGDLPGLTAYWTAKQAVEMDAKGLNPGVPVDAAKTVVAADAAKYDETAKKLTAFANNNIEYLRSSGVLSDDAADTILAKWNAYAPMNRVIDSGSGFGVGNSIRNPIKARAGSELDILNPIAQLINNVRSSLAIGQKNMAVKSFYDLASKAENPGDFFEEVPASLRPITVSADEMESFLAKQGIEGTPDDLLTTFRAMKTPLAPDEVGFFNDGKWTVLKVDPQIAAAFNETATPAHNLLMSLARGVASMFRSGLVSPDFIVRHLVRNQIATGTIAENPTVPFLTMFKGMADVLGKTDVYQDYLNSGAGMAADFTGDSPIDVMHKLVGESPETNFPQKAWNLVKTPFTFMHAAQAFLEKSTRVGAFGASMGDEARTPENIADAAVAARNVAPDPARIGSGTATWNAVTPLFNIELQHTDQLVKALTTTPVATLTRIFGLVTIPSIAAWYANQGNPAYEEAPEWEKNMFWMIPTGGATLRIPKPFLLGYIFGSGPEHILNAIYGKETAKNTGELAANLFESAVPNFFPAVARAPLEQITNHSFFRDAPLVPDASMKLLPEYRYSDYTTELTKQMGHMLGTVPYIGTTSMASPLVIDNYVREWTGASGSLMLSLADKALRAAGKLPDPVKPTDTLADIPVIKAFVVRYPSAQSASIEEFRQEYQRRSLYFNTVDVLKKEGNMAAATIMQNHEAEMVRLSGMHDSIAAASRFVHLINQNPETPPDEKRQLIDATYMSMIQIAKAGNVAFQQSAAQLEAEAKTLGH